MAALSALRTSLQNSLGFGTISTAQSNRLDRCINSAILQVVKESPDDSFLDEIINTSILQVVNESPDDSFLDEIINSAILQLVNESPDDSFLDEIINSAVLQLVNESPNDSFLDEIINTSILQIVNESPDDSLLDEVINSAVLQLVNESPDDSYLDEIINSAVLQVVNESPNDSYLDEIINTAVLQVVNESPDDSYLDEIINSAVLQVVKESPDDSYLDEIINSAIFQVVNESPDDSQLDEALNSGIQRAIADGVPGLARDIFTTKTWDTTTLTLTHTAGAATATYSESTASNLFNHDIVKSGSDYYIIQGHYKVGSPEVDTLNFGSPLPDSIAGSVTVYRRSIELPTSGKLISVFDVTNGQELPYDPLRAHLETGTSGSPQAYDQRYDTDADKSILSLYPAPDTQIFLRIQQQENYTADADLNWPDDAIDAVLERARAVMMSFRGDLVTPVEATLMDQSLDDVDDILKDSSSPLKIFVRE